MSQAIDSKLNSLTASNQPASTQLAAAQPAASLVNRAPQNDGDLAGLRESITKATEENQLSKNMLVYVNALEHTSEMVDRREERAVKVMIAQRGCECQHQADNDIYRSFLGQYKEHLD